MRLNEEYFSPTKTFAARGTFVSFLYKLTKYSLLPIAQVSKRGGLLMAQVATVQEATGAGVNHSIDCLVRLYTLPEFYNIRNCI